MSLLASPGRWASATTKAEHQESERHGAVTSRSAHGRAQGTVRCHARRSIGLSWRAVSAVGAQQPVAPSAARADPWRGFWPALVAIVLRRRPGPGALHRCWRRPGPRRGSTTSSTSARCPSCWPTGRASWRRSSTSSSRWWQSRRPSTPRSTRWCSPARPSSVSRRPTAQRLAGAVFGAGTIAAAGPARPPPGRRPRRPARGRAGGAVPDADRRRRRADERVAVRPARGPLAAGRLPAASKRPTPARAADARALWPGSPRSPVERRCCCCPCCWCPCIRRPGGWRGAPWRCWCSSRCSRPGRSATGRPSTAPCWWPPTPAPPSRGPTATRTCRRRQAGRLVARRASGSIRATRPSTTPRRCGTASAMPGDHVGRLPVVLAARLGRVWSVYRAVPDPGGPLDAGAEARGRSCSSCWSRSRRWGLVVLRRRRVSTWILLMPFVIVTVTALRPTATCASASRPSCPWWCLAAVALDALWPAARPDEREPATT